MNIKIKNCEDCPCFSKEFMGIEEYFCGITKYSLTDDEGYYPSSLPKELANPNEVKGKVNVTEDFMKQCPLKKGAIVLTLKGNK